MAISFVLPENQTVVDIQFDAAFYGHTEEQSESCQLEENSRISLVGTETVRGNSPRLPRGYESALSLWKSSTYGCHPDTAAGEKIAGQLVHLKS